MVDLVEVVSEVISNKRRLTDVEDAIAKGGNVNASKDSVSILSQAIQAQHAELVKLLLKKRASPELSDSKGVTPLHLATFDGSLEIMKYLISSRANFEVQDCHGQTPFFFVPNRRACVVLWNSKADPNVLNHKGQTPLHLAAHAGLNDAVQWLAENVSMNILDAQDKHGRTAVYCAAHSSLKSTVLLLQEKNADLSLRPKKRSGKSQNTYAAKLLDHLLKKVEGAKRSREAGSVPKEESELDPMGGLGALCVQQHCESPKSPEIRQDVVDELGGLRQEREEAARMEQARAEALEETRRAEEQARLEVPKLGKTPSSSPKVMTSTLKSLVPTLTKPKTVELEAGETVWKRNQDGILVWDVDLVKRSESDKYGFSHSSGKAEYLKSIGIAENTPEVDGPQVLFIRKIGVDGLLCAWNEAHADSVVQPGDRIDKVNGRGTMDQMAQELRGDKVRLEVQRYPEEFEVLLSKKASPKLGFKFEKPSNEKSKELKITEVGKEGALPDHNRRMADADRFHYVVAIGMRIIKVNSVQGDAFQMKEELKNAEEVTIKFRRQEVYALERARMMKQAQILASLSNLSGGRLPTPGL